CTALARRGGSPHPVAVADLERPRQARALDVAAPAQRHRGIGRLTRGREERLRVDRLACAANPPGPVALLFAHCTQKSRVSSSRRAFVRAWHPRPGHYTPLPRGSNECKAGERRDAPIRHRPTGAVLYRTIDRKYKSFHADPQKLPDRYLDIRPRKGSDRS